jgi:class 3 adenylate cyclase/ketosteroid isomerase-like protein
MTPTPLEASAELHEVARRFFSALLRGDIETMRSLWSRDESALSIGTDPEEWEYGGERILQSLESQFSTYGQHESQDDPSSWVIGDVHAWAEGSTGWAVDRSPATVADGSQRTARANLVFRLEDGVWRVVLAHFSLGVPNEEVFALERLAASVVAERPSLTELTGLDGTVSIVFTDIEASTEMAERLGDAAWIELLSWHDDLVRREAVDHRGAVVKSQGDGFMCAFPAATDALDFAFSVQSDVAKGYEGSPVRIRIGVNAGDVIRREEDFFGHAVIVAARVASKALGGEVLATELVSGLVQGVTRFEFGEPIAASLKGLEGTYLLRNVTLVAGK